MLEAVVSAFAIFIIIAILSEAIWETFKLISPRDVPPQVDRAAVMVLAIFMCVTTGSDLFKMLGVFLPWSSGAFFSGVLCSRGANFLHDLFKRVQGDKEAA